MTRTFRNVLLDQIETDRIIMNRILAIPIEDEMHDEVRAMAADEQRKLAQMGRVLIREAIEYRKTRGIAATQPSGEDVAAGEGIGRVGMKGTADRHPAPARSAGDTRTGANATGAQ